MRAGSRLAITRIARRLSRRGKRLVSPKVEADATMIARTAGSSDPLRKEIAPRASVRGQCRLRRETARNFEKTDPSPATPQARSTTHVHEI